MNLGFWEKLKRPILVLAPMADVTDAAFRRVIAKYGKPDVMWTEFVSADGLFLADEVGRAKLMKDLEFSEAERPIVAQFFTAKPEMMRKAAQLASELGFDGIDINMGCPDKSIEKQGAGAAMMKNPELAAAVIAAAKEGAQAAAQKSGRPPLPVSIKTRIGYNKNEIETWLPALLKSEPAVITFHARTRKEMSKVAAHWEVIKRAVEIRDALKSETLVFGNGDVENLEMARAKARATNCDGIMLGRAIFGNPWLFAEIQPTFSEKLKVLTEHTYLFEELLGSIKSFAIMKKHYKAYVQGFDGAKELRTALLEAKDAREVEENIKGSGFLGHS